MLSLAFQRSGVGLTRGPLKLRTVLPNAISSSSDILRKRSRVRKSNDLQEKRRGSLLYEGSSANQILRLPTRTASLEWSVHHAFSDVHGRERIALSVLWQPGQFSNTIVDSDDSSLRGSALGIAMDPRKLARALMALRGPGDYPVRL